MGSESGRRYYCGNLLSMHSSASKYQTFPNIVLFDFKSGIFSAHHQCQRLIRPQMKNSSSILRQLHEMGVLRRNLVNLRNIPTTCNSSFMPNMLLGGYWHAMKRTHEFLLLRVVSVQFFGSRDGVFGHELCCIVELRLMSAETFEILD